MNQTTIRALNKLAFLATSRFYPKNHKGVGPLARLGLVEDRGVKRRRSTSYAGSRYTKHCVVITPAGKELFGVLVSSLYFNGKLS